MTAIELLGRTATAYLARRIATEDPSEGTTARFLLDRLPGAHVVAICRRIQELPSLAARVRIRIPRTLGEPHGLAEEFLTDERTTHWRHAQCDRPVLLIANTEDDQGQSLRDVTSVGAQELLGEPDLWVAQAVEDLGLPDADLKIWSRALKGLQEARPLSLDTFARYILATRSAVSESGLPPLHALGWALPELRVPRDSAFFNVVPERGRTHTHHWKRAYLQAYNKRAPYLIKQTLSQQPITSEQLRELWANVSQDVAPQHHAVVDAFITSPGNWNDTAEALSRLEWERDNIKALFDGLRTVRREPLGKETLDFYESELPEALTAEEHEYLNRLTERQTRESNDEDREFYERHRVELAGDRPLKTRWDKFIFGLPVEATDFSVGLLRCLERLFEQAGSAVGTKSLSIELQRRSKRDFLALNHDAISYFSRRYRGLRKLLTGPAFSWEVGDLFNFEKIVRAEEQRGRFKRVESSAKGTNQLRFDVALSCGVEAYAAQLIWHFDPDSICCEFVEDWERLIPHPLVLTSVTREPVSRKGQLQAIDLEDVQTLEPVFRQSRGSLIPVYGRDRDLAALVPRALDDARDRRRLTVEGHSALRQAWDQFIAVYSTAISDVFEEGVAASSCLELEPAYCQLIESLHRHAPGDANRAALWHPVLSLGIVPVEGGPPAAIVAPWHPLRLLEMAIKARQLCGLVRHLIKSDTVDFGDARLFFADLAEELRHPYYPEVCLGLEGTQPTLLAHSDCYADYSLMEPAVADPHDEDATNENPSETARQVYRLVEEYLALLPHERANLSVVLYNCNSARLPQALVNVLGELYEDDEEEVRCQIVLRHRNARRLHDLYEKILEGSEADANSFVASEASRDFMARLRIGIMADSAPLPGPNDGPPMDLVFLQDVIARLADQMWLAEASDVAPADLLHHVPPRWSRRRPTSRDDRRAVAFLACPVQPLVGWRYLQALNSVIRSAETELTARPVPARQISFQNNTTREIFEEVHRLGQWVVHSDDILTRRQLRNQGVQVIRYRQQRHSDRNLTISSRAPLNLLEVMVLRRLQNLNLGLGPEELRSLAHRMMDDASDLSGDIVLRAAKRGEFANELIGLVLSRFLLESECGPNATCGWYFLDDYAAWLGQREEHLADILALSPRREGDQIVLVALISEAKYISSDLLAKARRTSAVQLRETASRVAEALFGNPGRLDRDLWLARLGDMLLDGIEVAGTEAEALNSWRHAIRSGRARILLRSYSHVFVHTQQPGEADPSCRDPIAKVEHGWQEVFGRDRVRDLVLAYFRRAPPTPIRAQLGDDKPWEAGEPTLPTRPVVWTAVPRQTPDDRTPIRASPPERPRAAVNDEVRRSGEPTSRPAAAPPESEALATPPRGDDRPRTDHVPSGLSVESPPAPPDGAFAWARPALRRVLEQASLSLAAETEDSAWLDSTVQRLRTALLSYQLQARVLASRLTPNAALVRLQGSDRLRISDIESRREELLTTHGLNVTNVFAEPGQVVVVTARPRRQLVDLINVWRDRTVDRELPGANRSLILGIRETDGAIQYLCPGEIHAPHTLVAGTTGSGKSILLQNLLLDIAATNDLTAARIVLIDPKQGADYLDLRALPHLERLVVTQDDARAVLEATVSEMDRRYALFGSAGVSNIARYNARASADQRLPVRWVFHDEFAAWMLMDDYKETVSSIVQRLGVMARAAGIFLVFAAQRPEDRVMPLQLRDNLGNRLVLRVESAGTSRIALGEEGAERLLGRGHLAARLPDQDRLVLAQVPMLAADQLEPIVQAIAADVGSRTT